MTDVEVVVAHAARATLRVGDVFLKVDADERGIDNEVAAMALAPVPTPEVLWRQHPVLAISVVTGTALGVLEERSTASPTAWRAAGAAIRALHDAPLPPWSGAVRRLRSRRRGRRAQGCSGKNSTYFPFTGMNLAPRAVGHREPAPSITEDTP
jgi:hypothetical protein